MAKAVLKLTETSAVVKVTGTGATTINLDTDLLSPTQVLSGTVARRVGISFIQYSTGGNIIISRNGVNVFELHNNTGTFDLAGYGGCSDYTDANQNIVVTITGGGTMLIALRKDAGYDSKIETHKFGPYDNTTVVGS